MRWCLTVFGRLFFSIRDLQIVAVQSRRYKDVEETVRTIKFYTFSKKLI